MIFNGKGSYNRYSLYGHCFVFFFYLSFLFTIKPPIVVATVSYNTSTTVSVVEDSPMSSLAICVDLLNFTPGNLARNAVVDLIFSDISASCKHYTTNFHLYGINVILCSMTMLEYRNLGLYIN